VQRRVARTKAAIEDAFVQLVLERGYDKVTVEDITDRADLARATFYVHYPNKEAVQFAVFNRLTEDLVQRIANQGGPWNVVPRDVIQAAYKQAAEMPDLYRACLSDARTRQAHLSTLSRYAEQNFRDRLTTLGNQPRVPVPVMARAMATSSSCSSDLRLTLREPTRAAAPSITMIFVCSIDGWKFHIRIPAEIKSA
jgi:AcrR family transcriptional regulator